MRLRSVAVLTALISVVAASVADAGEARLAVADGAGMSAAVGPRGAGAPAGAAPLRDGGLQPLAGRGYVEREVVVRFDPQTTRAQRAHVAGTVGALAQDETNLPGVEVVELAPNQDIHAAIARLETAPGVAYAEPNYLFRSLSLPSDPRFGELWGLDNLGQMVNGLTGTPGADIDAPEAWDLTTGSKDVKVAVVDSGVDLTHPDLAPNVVAGYDFVDNDTQPFDLSSHGTHVAGTIGARGNDGYGVAGVNWNVSIIPVRVLGGDGMGSMTTIAAGMKYALDRGAKVVNLSLGGPSSAQVMRDVIAAAPKTLFVAAAGNDGEDNDTTGSFPCNYDLANVICVAATDAHDDLAPFSNFGAMKVDLAAPGVDILSSVPPSSIAFRERFETTPAFVRGGTNSSWGMEVDPMGRYASDSPYDFYLDNTDSYIRTENPIDLTGKSGCLLAYWMYLDTELQADGMLVEASTDGTTWTVIDGWTGWSETWYPFTADLAAYNGRQIHIRFRLFTDADITADGVYLDDVVVGCDVAGYTGNDYEFMPGTSMATPHVAGVAALLYSVVPTATVAQVRAAILQGADPKLSLAGKTVTGGRLNARRALELILAEPTDDGTSTTKIVTIQKTRSAITVVGEVTPPHDGFNMAITLFRKSDGRYQRVAKKTPALVHRTGFDDRSFFVAKFSRPTRGDCRINAVFVGDADHAPSRARRLLSC